jgi:hypothetical protein
MGGIMSSWRLMDSPDQTIVGTLSEVEPGNPVDGDTGFNIQPDAPFRYILKNHLDDWNEDGKIHCEINVWPQWRTDHGLWVASMSAWKVTAAGVWVEDTGHDDNKTELHPVDVVFGRIDGALGGSLISEDWIHEIEASRHLIRDQSLFLFRFAIATDVRAFFPIDDQSDGRPPLAGMTRPVTFTPALPTKPPSHFFDPWEPAWEMRTALTHGTIVDIHTAVRLDDSGGKLLDITITPQSLTDEEYEAGTTTDQGAAVLLGEFVTFWQKHAGHT